MLINIGVGYGGLMCKIFVSLSGVAFSVSIGISALLVANGENLFSEIYAELACLCIG